MWWNNITNDIAYQFLNECEDYTNKVRAKDKFMLSRNFKEDFVKREFNPFGAIITCSNTENSIDSLRSLYLGNYGTHFIITKKTDGYKNDYELLKDLPAMILTPCSMRYIVHAGFMSLFAWGIQLTNLGKLRQIKYNFFGSKPIQIPYNEESDKIFRSELSINKYDYYHWKNFWTSKVELKTNSVKPFGNYVFELPHYKQIISLIILLKVLNKITPLDRNYVLPYHCINNRELHIPNIYWEDVRKYVFEKELKENDITFDNLMKNNYSNKKTEDITRININNIDEEYIDQLNKRNTRYNKTVEDVGEIEYVMNKRSIILNSTNNVLRNELKRYLSKLGYNVDSSSNINLAVNLLIMADKNNMNPINFKTYENIDVLKFVKKIYHKIRGTNE